MYGVDDIEIARRLQNYFPDLGALHIGINQGADVANNIFFLIQNIYKAVAPTKTLKKNRIPLREQMAFLEVINAGWLFLRDKLGPRLLRKRSITACSFYWLLENTIPSALLHYGVVLKSGTGTDYYEGLLYAYIEFALKDRRNYKKALLQKIETYQTLLATDHVLLKILRDACRFCDEATNEGGIIGRLADIMKLSLNVDIAINKAYVEFASRMENNTLSLLECLSKKSGHACSFFGRNVDIILPVTINVILDTCERLINENIGDIQYIKKEAKECNRYNCISFKSKALTGGDTILCSHLHGAPSFAFYPASPPTVFQCMKCLQSCGNNPCYFACGCNFCDGCGKDPSLKCRCSDALNQFITTTKNSMKAEMSKQINLKETVVEADANGGGDDMEDNINPNEVLDAKPKQMATLDSECDIVAQILITNSENTIPADALPSPSFSFLHNGRELQSYLVQALKDEISKFPAETITKYTKEKLYKLNKENLITLLHQLLTHTPQQ